MITLVDVAVTLEWIFEALNSRALVVATAGTVMALSIVYTAWRCWLEP